MNDADAELVVQWLIEAICDGTLSPQRRDEIATWLKARGSL